MLKERRLNGMKFTVFLEALNGCDFIPLMHDGESQARIDSAPIHVDGAGTALAVVAAFFRAEKMKIFAKGIEQSYTRLKLQLMFCPIDSQRHGHGVRGLWCGWRGRNPALPDMSLAEQGRACDGQSSNAPFEK